MKKSLALSFIFLAVAASFCSAQSRHPYYDNPNLSSPKSIALLGSGKTLDLQINKEEKAIHDAAQSPMSAAAYSARSAAYQEFDRVWPANRKTFNHLLRSLVALREEMITGNGDLNQYLPRVKELENILAGKSRQYEPFYEIGVYKEYSGLYQKAYLLFTEEISGIKQDIQDRKDAIEKHNKEEKEKLKHRLELRLRHTQDNEQKQEIRKEIEKLSRQ
ncbi:MAG: hypothetical protein LBR90_00830 [Elusimicrobiota bacterium]|jgi:hypothetical protein|nr:hypothetical protein [Elusimicrobiota bacterium]